MALRPQSRFQIIHRNNEILTYGKLKSEADLLLNMYRDKIIKSLNLQILHKNILLSRNVKVKLIRKIAYMKCLASLLFSWQEYNEKINKITSKKNKGRSSIIHRQGLYKLVEAMPCSKNFDPVLPSSNLFSPLINKQIDLNLIVLKFTKTSEMIFTAQIDN